MSEREIDIKFNRLSYNTRTLIRPRVLPLVNEGKYPRKVELLDLDLLDSPSYQRYYLPETLIRSIALNMDIAALGCFTISVRQGKYWILDAQNRYMACRLRGDIKKVPCIVYENLTIEEEIEIFLHFNRDRKPLSAADRHYAHVAAGDVHANFLNKLFVARHIDVVSTAKEPLDFGAIGDLTRIVKRAFTPERQESYRIVINLCAMISQVSGKPLVHQIMSGLLYLELNLVPVAGTESRLDNDRLQKKLIGIGHQALKEAAEHGESGKIRIKGGGSKYKHYGLGILRVLNESTVGGKMIYRTVAQKAEKKAEHFIG